MDVTLQSDCHTNRPTNFERKCIAWYGKNAAPPSLNTELWLPAALERALTLVPTYGHPNHGAAMLVNDTVAAQLLTDCGLNFNNRCMIIKNRTVKGH